MTANRRAWALTGGSRVQAGEHDLLYSPRVGRGVGLVFGHGAGGNAMQAQSVPKGMYKLNQALAAEGFHVSHGDLGGMYTFGNDVVAARVEASRQLLIGEGCGPRIVLMGASMGNLSIMRYMADQPANVICGVGIIPAIDIEQVRAENWNGMKAFIETAWGVDAVTPIPARGIPQGRVAEMTSVPWAAWYGTADTVTAPPDIIAMAAALGADSQATAYDSTYDHSDQILNVLPVDDIIEWVVARVESE